jgi:5-methylcytosine-specific restriction endonuclease McrA
LEYLLFEAKRSDGSRVVPDPKQIKYITLEIPKPQNKNAPRKGEQTRTERRQPKAILHEETFGKCIYCDKEIAVTDVTEDHIFPRSLGGPDIREANLVCSCLDCNVHGKANTIPWLWREHIKPSWEDFEKRVRDNPRMRPRKKDILLLGSHAGDIERLASFKELGIPASELSDEQRAEFAALANWKEGDPFPSDPTALVHAIISS